MLTQGDQILFKNTIKNRSDGTVVNIAGYILTFRWWYNDGPVNTATGTITDSTNGLVQYQIPAPGLTTSGKLNYEWLVDDGSVEVMTDQVFQVSIRRKR
jgi:hypothetical protein